MVGRVVLHADMDAFYASIEIRDNPELRGKPVIVGAVSGRGVVAAASYEARKFGVRSAMPGFRARELCPHGVFLPSDMARYSRVSSEVHEVFERFSPEIEPIALDEAFLDVTGSVGLFGGPLALGRELRAEVRRSLGLPISVGIGPSKLVAKLACTLSKPDGFLYVPEEAVEWLLFPLPIRRLWGVGPVLEEALVALGIRTIGDLSRVDESLLARAVGDRAAALQRLARGADDRDVESALAPKSIGEENTFERDVTDRDVVTAALTSHAEAVARRGRHEGYQGRTITLKVKLGKARGYRTSRIDPAVREPIYPLLTRARTLQQATSDGKRIRDVAVALWDEAKIAEPVRLLGVSLSNLEGGAMEQLDLFGTRVSTDRLGPALDAITARFGKGAIRRAVDDPEKATASGRRKRGEE
jgi:DNA polymerase-4